MNPLNQIRVVCVRPLYGGNVGSVCRAMANCGLSRLTLVSPDVEMDREELQRMALKALPLYREREEFDTLEAAVADCVAVAATSGLDGFYRDQAVTPREVAPDLLSAAARGPVALVFGSEDKGLRLEELTLATHLLRIPSDPAFSSLNLAQAVMVCVHELYVAAGAFHPPMEKSPPAAHAFRERMFAAWRETMRDIRFCPDEKTDHMMLGLRRILTRGELTENDVKILLGLARQASWAAHTGPAAGDQIDGESDSRGSRCTTTS
jgi:tRNA/rRNA methyltransferase